MDARTSFREALEDVHRYKADGLARRPAFISTFERLGKANRRDVRALPKSSTANSISGGVADVSRRMVDDSTSAVEQLQQSLDIIRTRDSELNAFVHMPSEDALLKIAESLDKERGQKGVRGPLHGMPVSVKDVIHVKGMPTTSSSKVMADYVPDDDATAVRLLREAGAIIMGKTHTHEFALGVTTSQSRNPWDTQRDPGGSSGGSAISIATQMSLLSLGTDTRASIRVPAALCGIAGYKPTFGLVSTDGIITLSWSMDHAGLQGRTAEDVAIMLNAVQGMDVRDLSTLDRPSEDYTDFVSRDVRGLRVGVAVNGLIGADAEVKRVFETSVEALRSLGVEIAETEIPWDEDFRLATSLGLIVSRAEAAEFHQSFDNPGSLYTKPVFEQLDEASKVTAVDYVNAQRFRSEFQERMVAHMNGFDALMMPTTLVTAPKVEESDEYLMILSRNCIPWSFIGFPVISTPAGLTSERLPVGTQFVSSPFDDGIILALSSALESVTDIPAP
jgi:aspartyl-tRNA(Asn)/glutamyl-tRNA(Gln) amidotransferase subunit A